MDVNCETETDKAYDTAGIDAVIVAHETGVEMEDMCYVDQVHAPTLDDLCVEAAHNSASHDLGLVDCNLDLVDLGLVHELGVNDLGHVTEAADAYGLEKFVSCMVHLVDKCGLGLDMDHHM